MFTKVIAVLLLVLIVLSGCSVKTTPQPTTAPSPPQSPTPIPQNSVISSAEAQKHIGKLVTVEFVVADTRYASRSRGQPTFLNDKPYPNHAFTVVIWGRDRSKFGSPERSLKGKRIRVTGFVEPYERKAQIVAKETSQIQIMD